MNSEDTKMDFIDKLHLLSSQVQRQIEHIKTEEATKTALVMPFLNALGYNVFDPTEVSPEFTADVGTKKGEKVDYVILMEGKPIILIECKFCGSTLDKDQASQLYRYFSVTEAKFGILTNGLIYRFFSDLEEPNKMDAKPFFEFNLQEIKESAVEELKKFTKDSFNIDITSSAASELKYLGEIKRYLGEQILTPDQDFTYFLCSRTYTGKITQSVRERFTDLVKKAFSQFINDRINERLKLAMDQHTDKQSEGTSSAQIKVEQSFTEQSSDQSKIETTEEEIEAYHIVKALLRDVCNPSRIAIRDTQSYCGVLLDNNNRKSICRFYFNTANKYLAIIKEDKSEEKVKIEGLDDIYKYSDKLKTTLSFYDVSKSNKEEVTIS